MRHDDLCGLVTFWRSAGAGALAPKFQEIYLNAAGEIQSDASTIARTFLAGEAARGSRDPAIANRAIANFRQALLAEMRAAIKAQTGKTELFKSGDLPEATGPDLVLLNRNYPPAGKAYGEFSRWFEEAFDGSEERQDRDSNASGQQ